MRLSFNFTISTTILMMAATLSLFLTIAVDSSYASTKTGVNLPTPIGRGELKITFYDKWGEEGSEDGQFLQPGGIDLDSLGNVYVIDVDNHRVQKFTSDGTYIDQWGHFGTGNGEFNHPSQIAVDSSDNVYVVDTYNHNVQKFTSDGTFIDKWGEAGHGESEFWYPNGVAVDSDDNFYVADSYNHRIQKFRSDGSFIREWGSECNMSTGADCNLDAPGALEIGDGQFNGPYDVAVDSEDNVYVTDGVNDRIQKFQSSGIFIRSWGEYGNGEGELEYPLGISLDSFDDVYVVDPLNFRIQKFTNTGYYLTQRGQTGSGDGEFGSLNDIVIKDGTGINTPRGDEIYVTDVGNYRVQVLKWTLIGNR